MDELGEATDSLRYLVARPGTFEDFYPETTDDMLIRVLVDAFAEAQLMGLLLTYDSDEDGFLTPTLTSGQGALVTLFAACRFLTSELINRNTQVVYEAGSAHYETTQATNILRDILKNLNAQKSAVIGLLGADATGTAGAAAAFYMADQYLVRAWSDSVTAGW